MPPEVTAVITTHVRPTRAHEALASVRAETYRDIEIVIVDDGGAFVMPGHDAGLAVEIVRGSGAGVARARNLGLAAARGKYIIFLDDDDVAMPHRVASLVRAAEDQQAALCFGMTRRVVDGSTDLPGDVPTHLASTGMIRFCDLLSCAPHVNAVLARTEALRDVGGFDIGADHFDDWSAWLRIADRGASIWCVAETVADWRIHDQGLSGEVLRGNVMKSRILSLFDRLSADLSSDHVRVIAAAGRIVESARIVTYDDYADAMALARGVLRGGAACFCGQLNLHRFTVNDDLCVVSASHA